MHFAHAVQIDRLYRRIHTWPIIERVENVVHFCMPLMVNLRVCALNERFLLINWREDSLSRVTI